MSMQELQEQIGLAILEQVRTGHMPASKIVLGDLIEHQENITNNYAAGSNPVYNHFHPEKKEPPTTPAPGDYSALRLYLNKLAETNREIADLIKEGKWKLLAERLTKDVKWQIEPDSLGANMRRH